MLPGSAPSPPVAALGLGDDAAIVEGGSSAYFCVVCCLDLGGASQAREHAVSKKHKRRAQCGQQGMISRPFDDALRGAGVCRVLALGDCHGGRALSLFSALLRSRFYGGSAFSWAVGSRGAAPMRQLPPLEQVLGRDARLLRAAERGALVLVMSYGEIDVRCHAAKWCGEEAGAEAEAEAGAEVGGGASPDRLARAYVARVRQYVREYAAAAPGNSAVRVLPLLLAVPPASDQGHNDRAPFAGTLAGRVRATRRLNAALEAACVSAPAPGGEPGASLPVLFSGADTWHFAQAGPAGGGGGCGGDGVGGGGHAVPGSLRRDMSDGHVHVQPQLCAPVHARVRQVVARHLQLHLPASSAPSAASPRSRAAAAASIAAVAAAAAAVAAAAAAAAAATVVAVAGAGASVPPAPRRVKAWEAQVAEFQRVFAQFDRDGDGTMATKDLGAAVRALGRDLCEAELQGIISEVDDEGSGVIDFPEFLSAVCRRHCCGGCGVGGGGEEAAEAEVLEAFRAFDTTNNGTVAVTDFAQIVRSLGENSSDAEFNEMMAEMMAAGEADDGDSGRVDYADFVRMMMAK